MVAIELVVGLLAAVYLSLLTVVLTYFGFDSLGADLEERTKAEQMA